MNRLSLFVGAIALASMLSAIPAQAQATSVEDVFGPDITFPICLNFDNFCDGIEMSAIAADKMVVATWQNHDCAGSDLPMLGGFTKGPPRRAYIMGASVFTPGTIFVFTVEVDLGTFDLWYQDAAGNLTMFQDDQPYTATVGACPFRPETGLRASTAVD